MIRGIGGQPWVDLSTDVDLEPFLSMKWKIFSGISKAKTINGGYFPNLLESFDTENARGIQQLVQQLPESLYTVDQRIQNGELGAVCKGEYSELNELERRQFLKLAGGYQPYRAILLKEPKPPYNWTDSAEFFPELIDWIRDLPFVSLQRVIIYLVDALCPLVLHKDWLNQEKHQSEFMLLRVTDEKSFFVFDDDKKKKYHIDSPVAFFNEADWHGGEPIFKQAVSIKVSGEFRPDIRKRCGYEIPAF